MLAFRVASDVITAVALCFLMYEARTDFAQSVLFLQD